MEYCEKPVQVLISKYHKKLFNFLQKKLIFLSKNILFFLISKRHKKLRRIVVPITIGHYRKTSAIWHFWVWFPQIHISNPDLRAYFGSISNLTRFVVAIVRNEAKTIIFLPFFVLLSRSPACFRIIFVIHSFGSNISYVI